MSSTNEQGIGQRLLTLRKRFGITRRQVSNLIDVSEISLLRAETRSRHKSHVHIERQIKRVVDILEKRAEAEDREKGGSDEPK